MKKTVVIIMCITAVLGLAGCTPSRQELATKVGKSMQENFPQEFKLSRFEEPPASGKLAPTLVFEGQSSTLITIMRKPFLSGMFDPDMTMTGIARTNKGRYFYFDYTSKVYDQEHQMKLRWGEKPCLQPKCRTFSGHSITADDAKARFFNSEEFTPDRFKELFGEAPPPKRVAA